MRSIAFIVLITACASTPTGFFEEDFEAIRGVLATTPSLERPPDAFLIREIDSFNGLDAELVAPLPSEEGWSSSQRILCRRVAEPHEWRCAEPKVETYVHLPGGRASQVAGLHGETAAALVAFLVSRSHQEAGPAHLSSREIQQIECVGASAHGGKLVVEFSGVWNHASYTPGLLIAQSTGSGFEVLKIYRPSWASPTPLLAHCMTPTVDIFPSRR